MRRQHEEELRKRGASSSSGVATTVAATAAAPQAQEGEPREESTLNLELTLAPPGDIDLTLPRGCEEPPASAYSSENNGFYSVS